MTAPHPARQWLTELHAPGQAARRVICFPHAGGSATAFRGWIEHLPAALELWAVQYPGREERADEPLCPDLRELARQAAFALQWMTDLPYQMFGHSMGAVVAYETCCQLSMLGLRAPERLWASGSPSPDLAGSRSGHRPGDTVRPHLLTDDQDTPADVSRERELLAAEILNADLGALSDYRVQDPLELSCRLTVVRYSGDDDISDTDVQGWRRFAGDEPETLTLPGDHFTCLTDPADTVTELFREHP
jgi:pyochelin biosynthetic protein PchC